MCMRMWCIGKIIKKVTHGLANFSAKFEIDEASSLLTLNSADYYTTSRRTPITTRG